MEEALGVQRLHQIYQQSDWEEYILLKENLLLLYIVVLYGIKEQFIQLMQEKHGTSLEIHQTSILDYIQ